MNWLKINKLNHFLKNINKFLKILINMEEIFYKEKILEIQGLKLLINSFIKHKANSPK